MKRRWFGTVMSLGVGLACLVAEPGRSATAQSPGPSRAPAFEADRNWPTLPPDRVLGEVSSIAVDDRDHIWVLHRPRSVPADQRAKAAPPVLEFDATGKLLNSWGGTPPVIAGQAYEWPEREHGIYVDSRGFVWIGGNNGYGTPPPPGNSDDMLLKFTSAGKFVLQIGHSGKSQGNADTANVRQAADAALYRPTNELFVADGYGNNRVVVFDADSGAFKRMWGAFGNKPEAPVAGPPSSSPPATGRSGPPQFGLVHAIRVSNDGLVYVADRANRRVQVFGIDGTYRQETMIGGDGSAAQTAAGLAFSADKAQQYLYVADLGNAQIVVLDRRTLRSLGAFGKRGGSPGDFDILHHMAVDSKGNIYTAEIGRNRRAQKFIVKMPS